ncbi:hypothetical protein ACF046_04650 [Glutamicibacter creatinolyticus]|uniref:hypothetical protein n=1 Tax=Glutamicibacter creatinolyticus TaxID=162496 RepID=UPI0033ED970E
MTSKSSNIPAIERATGIGWGQWVEHLGAAQAQTLAHARIAELAEQRMPHRVENSGWWAQSVAVAYEQHIERRLPGQAHDGSFQFSVSRTIDADMDQALQRWQELVQERGDFNGVPIQEPGRASSTPKWRYWRIGLQDGARIAVNISAKGAKSAVVVNHSGIMDPDLVENWKSYWRSLLAQLPS